MYLGRYWGEGPIDRITVESDAMEFTDDEANAIVAHCETMRLGQPDGPGRGEISKSVGALVFLCVTNSSIHRRDNVVLVGGRSDLGFNLRAEITKISGPEGPVGETWRLATEAADGGEDVDRGEIRGDLGEALDNRVRLGRRCQTIHTYRDSYNFEFRAAAPGWFLISTRARPVGQMLEAGPEQSWDDMLAATPRLISRFEERLADAEADEVAAIEARDAQERADYARMRARQEV